MDRREFLARTGLALGAAALASARSAVAAKPAPAPPTWDWLRAQFDLDPAYIHMTQFFLSSHPRPVREAIDAHRRALDRNPYGYFDDNVERLEAAVLAAAAHYLGGDPTDIALTDSTTMGLGLLYGMLDLAPGQEIVTTTHDHYSTVESLRLRADRTGAGLKSVPLYDQPARATTAEIVARMTGALGPRTRVLAVTWVHSSTGVKLPLRAMADALARVNAGRDERDRVLFCVDGVHGLGNQAESVAELGCDFFVAGCHKWLFGPRGTGLVWGRPAAWKSLRPVVPSFNWPAFKIFMGITPRHELPPSETYSPGGFKPFEHRWALTEAFGLHETLGRARVAERVAALNTQLKEGVRNLPGLTLHTPVSPEVSAGINCFEVAGHTTHEIVERLRARKVIASTAPYATQFARLSVNAVNTPEEVDRAVAALRASMG
jgi:selenocysteine lyase/cysteine desulfurase